MMEDKILMGHGSGGKLMNDLINGLIKDKFGPCSLQLDDSAVLPIGSNNIAFTTDTFTITPIFFPGGDIGELAVNGTVNDLAVMGAVPLYISSGFILEEGFPIADLEKVMDSMRKAAQYAGVQIVTGDTKVVEKGKADKIFINTSGIGLLKSGVQRQDIETGDLILINGTIGDHGISVMAQRNNFSFSSRLLSDCAALNLLIAAVLEKAPGAVKFMRDPTRGGVASVLNELVHHRPFSARLIEEKLPVKDEVNGVCDILGIDPLYAANEGKVIMVVKKEKAAAIVDVMRTVKEGEEAGIIGEISETYPGKVFVETGVGGKRMLPLLIEEQLPRIC
ncbi:MAG: hydrogenase expression/formation protein HypE [Candidatus Aminicenantes bacterium]|nr:hydrogenase expression/formation protein HypE [Candidatus Aminicenantes bacterium]